MTVPLQTRRSPIHLGNGVANSFSFDFKVFSQNDITVTTADADGVETLRVLNTDYSVSVNADQDATPGGDITYPISGTKLQTGEKLVIVGNALAAQLTDLQSYGFYPQSVEDMADKFTMVLQQINDTQGRTIALPDTAEDVDTTLPAPAANALIGWNAAADALENKSFVTSVPVSTFMAGVLDDTTASLARTTLGARKFANVKTDHGATGNGSADDTAAIQAAIDAVKAAGGIVYVPPGTYMVSRLDLAEISNRGFMFIGDGWDNTKFMPIAGTASYGTATGHLFDCTGSVGLTFRDFQVGAFNQTPEPTTCFFFSQIASNVSNAHHLDGLYITGKYTTATVYNYGVPSSDAVNCDFYNYKAGAGAHSVARWDSTNSASLTSSFATVTSGDLPTSDWTFTGCEFHKFPGAGGNNHVVRLDGADDIRFIGGNITGGASAYVGLLNSPARAVFLGTTFETESEPVTPTNVFDIPSGVAEGLSWDQCEYIVGSAIVGGAGGLLAGTGNLEFMLHSTPATGIGGGATIFLGPAGHSATEGQSETITTHRGVLNHMRVQSSAAPGAGQSYTITIRVNGADTGITATISDAASTASDLTHYVHVLPGDRISAKAVSSAGADTTARIKVAVGIFAARR